MNFIRTLLNCCAGFRFYRRLLSLHPLESIRFLAGIVFLLVLLQIGTFIPALSDLLDRGADWVQANLPRFEIRSGHAYYSSPEPFALTNEFVTIRIDTSGATNSQPYPSPYGLFIGRDKLQRWQPGINFSGPAPTITYDDTLRNYPEGTVDREYVRKLGKQWLWRLGPFAIALYFFFWLLAVLVQAYVFTLVISFAESTTLRKLGFNEFFNIAVHACAPALIVVTTLIIARTYSLEWLMAAFLATYFIYVMGATAACRQEEHQDKDEDGLM